jgi:hypothetical protein
VTVVPITIWKKLIIDRVHMTIPVGSKYLHGVLVSILKGLPDVQGNHVPNGKIKITEHHYLTRLDWYPSKNRRIAELEVGATKSKHRYFRVGLYPSKFKPGEFEYFKWALSTLLPWSYAILYEGARVSYMELATDSLSHAAHSFIAFRPKCGYSMIYIDAKGELGTTYLGSQTSALRFRIYDKDRQLKQNGLPSAHNPHTRIEAVSRHTGLVPSELVSKMTNPFARLEIADLPTAQHLTKAKSWQDFLVRCLEVGSAAALSHCYPNQRRQYVKHLRKAAAPWWQPKEVWKGLHHALVAIAP